jgi:hypothetical protein
LLNGRFAGDWLADFFVPESRSAACDTVKMFNTIHLFFVSGELTALADSLGRAFLIIVAAWSGNGFPISTVSTVKTALLM